MKEDIAFLRQRMNQEVAMSAAATNPSIKRIHDELADAYYAKIMDAQGETSPLPSASHRESRRIGS